MSTRYENDDFQFGFEIILGAAQRGGSAVGEVLATAGRIRNGDAEGWLREWTATAEAAEAAGARALAAGRRITASGYFMRAANYHATALYMITHTDAAEQQMERWRRQRAAWDRAVDLMPVPGERITIPYEGVELAAYFFRAPDAAAGEPRPLVVVNNGSDGATSATWLQGGAAAAERGYHWMTFDGPGQQSTLFELGIPFRPDWEAVLTPVVDAMVARPDVDAARLGLIGISQAGFWVPRALAFEHRFAAAVVDPGVTDVSASWTAPLPQEMRDQLDRGEKEIFDLEMSASLSPEPRAVLRFRGEPYMVAGDSVFDLYHEVRRYRLGDEVSQITTPLLITDPENEQFWPGQSRELYDLLPGPREIVSFTAHEGADRHCEPLGIALRDSRVFDWLDGHLAVS